MYWVAGCVRVATGVWLVGSVSPLSGPVADLNLFQVWYVDFLEPVGH